MSRDTTKYLLTEDRIPTHWVNLMADLPGEPLPPLNPQTKEPAGPPDLLAIFPESLILQEVSAEPEIEIPEEVREAYKLWRPTPLYRARRLERALGTPAHIYYKYEGGSPSGSHKPNTAIPQAYENARAGVRKITTETGAGPVGLLARVRVRHVRPGVRGLHGRLLVRPEALPPLDDGDLGRDRAPLAVAAHRVRARERRSTPPGSLGIAISEAVEIAAQNEDINYALGSVLNHVLLHQTVIGQESIAQMEMAGEEPDVVIACVGGGSNFGGLVIPWLRRNLRDGATTRFIGAEPAACPTLTKGVYAYDFGDTAGFTPLMPMYTLGHDFVPAARPRRRPALPRRLRRWSRRSSTRDSSRRAPTASRRRSPRACSSRGPRASSRRPSRRTRSAP